MAARSKELRPLSLERGTNLYAEGSCLIRMGDTVVLCTASVTQSVPARLRSGVGLGTVVVSCS